MGKTLLNVQVLYDKMGKAERKIADYLLSNPQNILNFSIGNLAKTCGCGEATITRFSKRLGFTGYQQMKLALAQDRSLPNINENINTYDNAYTIFTKVCSDIYASLEKTRASLNKIKLDEFCEKLLHIKRIYIFGLGNSASIAIDASHKLARIGFEATACNDNHMQAIAASHLHKGDVAIGVSHSGASIDVVDALKTAKQTGATTICITNFGESPINKYSDIVLNTRSDETKYSILAMSSRIAQLAIFDAIYTYIVMHSNKAAVQAIKDAENAQHSKKYIK
jgi:DNA-binding MurR/RpiR family transcriptional regulator